jgi:hypothetical protein
MELRISWLQKNPEVLNPRRKKDCGGSSETQNDAQQGSIVLAVVVAEILVVLVESIVSDTKK